MHVPVIQNTMPASGCAPLAVCALATRVAFLGAAPLSSSLSEPPPRARFRRVVFFFVARLTFFALPLLPTSPAVWGEMPT